MLGHWLKFFCAYHEIHYFENIFYQSTFESPGINAFNLSFIRFFCLGYVYPPPRLSLTSMYLE